MIYKSKQEIRRKIWQTLEDENIADFPRPCFGRIPNFVGSKEASEKIKEIPEFKKAKCVFCAPDFVLKRIREIVLEEGKTLAVALPHMTGFVEITEKKKIKEATSIGGFKKYGKPLQTKIDLFVQGSVAVDKFGNRLGKGTGYGDKEWHYLYEKGLISPNVKIVTIVHDKQILDDFSYLAEPTDRKVNYIITPSRIIKTKVDRSYSTTVEY